MEIGLTLEEEIYERPCIVDDSKNSRKISIFTDGVAFKGGERWNYRCLVFSTLYGSSYSNILQVQMPRRHWGPRWGGAKQRSAQSILGNSNAHKTESILVVSTKSWQGYCVLCCRILWCLVEYGSNPISEVMAIPDICHRGLSIYYVIPDRGDGSP